jgi:hypothetical protein
MIVSASRADSAANIEKSPSPMRPRTLAASTAAAIAGVQRSSVESSSPPVSGIGGSASIVTPMLLSAKSVMVMVTLAI